MAQALVSIDVLIVGDEAVGKSNFVIRQTTKQFPKYNVPTLGVSYHKSTVTLGGETTLMEIYDSSGKEYYRCHLSNFFGSADVVILMYDVTNQRSFDNLQIWNADVASYCEKDVCKFVIGNNKDPSLNRITSEMEARRFSSAIGATYFECSSSTNVEDIFHNIVLNVRKKWTSISDITMIPLYTPCSNFNTHNPSRTERLLEELETIESK